MRLQTVYSAAQAQGLKLELTQLGLPWDWLLLPVMP